MDSVREDFKIMGVLDWKKNVLDTKSGNNYLSKPNPIKSRTASKERRIRPPVWAKRVRIFVHIN
jgi:hypothetical protein